MRYGGLDRGYQISIAAGWGRYFVLLICFVCLPAAQALADGDPPPAPLAAAAAAPTPSGSTPQDFRMLAATEAKPLGLPPEIADAVMAVESSYNPSATGAAGEIGLMQVMPSTARLLGFVGANAELAIPATNIHYGVTYLAAAWRLAAGDLCTAVMKYRAGHGETRFSYQSVDYCLAVRSKLAARGYPVVGSVPVATFGERTASCRRCTRGIVGRVNLAALNTRLSILVTQVRGNH
jgi:soluble lytic murein transglycosylase-like protein